MTMFGDKIEECQRLREELKVTRAHLRSCCEALEPLVAANLVHACGPVLATTHGYMAVSTARLFLQMSQPSSVTLPRRKVLKKETL